MMYTCVRTYSCEQPLSWDDSQMAAVRESRGPDSDGNGSLTPSEQSDNDDRSEHDSDYETEDEDDRLEPRCKALNIQWTGYGRRVPVILFNAETILNRRTDFKTVGERYHLAFKFASTDCKIVRNILLSHGFHEVHPNSTEYNLIWSNSHLKPFTLRTMSEFQKINHFPRSYELTRKDRLFKNIQRMQQTKGFKHFDFIPQSFVLPGDYQDFCSTFIKDKGPYIVKPVASSRGRGVFLINHPDQVPLDENVIVSKYISSPLVIDGFKFDMRIYVAVTSYDPLVIYLYEEGLTRFATVKYEKNMKHMRNQCMHLTNYSVNKRSQDYVKNDDPDVEDYGNKWSMGAMLRYLRSEGKDTAALMMRIEDVVIKTILSVESSVATACKMFQPFRGNCFELYGFDILLDESLKPWVLEVNLSPSLACDSPLDLKIKSNMLCDLLSLAGVICHDPLMRSRQQVSKQAAEITVKLKSKLKGELDDNTAELLGQIEAARLYMKDTDNWLMSRTRSQSVASSASKERQANSALGGLNSEEIRIVRRVREEEARQGGWIRIFPNADSWDTYGVFLQFPTTHNLMLHQRLYQERHKGILPNRSPGGNILAPSRSKNGIQMQVAAAGKVDQEKFIESYAQALLRAKQYERRLGQVKKPHRRKHSKSKRGKLMQGVHEAEDNGEFGGSDEDGGHERVKEKKVRETKAESREKAEGKSTGKQGASMKVHHNISGKELAQSGLKDKDAEKALDKDEAGAVGEPHRIPSPNLPFSVSKYDVIGLLQKGHVLSKVQARTAFAMYLIRVQQRLLSDCGNVLQQDDIDALNEQMDLVLRFLKRAAANLHQIFRVVVPSKRLPLGDRRRILARQLGDFVHLYNKETDTMKAMKVRGKLEGRRPKLSESCEGLDEIQFDQFVYTASEGELEEVLTTYTKINKSAAIFLGGDSKPGMLETKKENLIRRSVYLDNIETTVSVGSADGATRLKHDPVGQPLSGINNNNNKGLNGEVSKTSIRPGSAQLHPASPHSYSTTVAIYTQKLRRPRSASNSVVPLAANTTENRPASSSGNFPVGSIQNPVFTTLDPIVDTYNEKAIQDALQRLALRQQVRQYSVVNGTSVLRPEALSSKPPPGLGSTASADRESKSSPAGLSVGQIFVAAENHLAHSLTKNSSDGTTNLVCRPFHPGVNTLRHPRPQSTLMAAASNNFVQDPSSQQQNVAASACSEVTGAMPQNYHTTSFNNRQFQIAQQAAVKQRLMDQSKAMLEVSKAKHEASVSQAQFQRSSFSLEIPSTSAHGDVFQDTSSTNPEHIQSFKTVVPKPPEQMSYIQQRNGFRSTRKPTVGENNLNFHFHSNLLAAGQDNQS
ncbi:hypothetical protein BsWGS_10001 [Bradybaena similaris]